MSSDAAQDELLEAIEAADDQGEIDTLRALVADGRRRFPDATVMREWEATLAIDDGRSIDALAALDAILRLLPGDFAAQRERASVLVDLGRFQNALAGLSALPADDVRRLPKDERAGIRYEAALCCDRLGDIAAADIAYGDAARLASAQYFVPHRHSREAFEAMVASAIDSIPARFAEHLADVTVVVREWPDDPRDDMFQLGLYLTDDATPGTIVVFQRPHELQCQDQNALRDEVRHTLLHEVAHHFGLSDDEIGD